MLEEIETKWDLCDLAIANEILDVQQELAEEEEARRRAEARRDQYL